MSQETQGKHDVAKHSLSTLEPINHTDEKQLSLDKLPKKSKTLPPRGPKGWFMAKGLSDTDNSSSTFTSSASSPLDTPEINEQQLIPDEEESEYRDNLDHEVAEPRAILLPAFHWGSTVLQSEPDNLPFPPAQPPSPPHVPLVQSISTPAKSRARPATVPTQTPKISAPMAGPVGNPPPLFHGRDDENATSFIRSFEGYIIINHITDEAVKILLFSTFISAGSEADVWWTSLSAQAKSTWTLAKAAFLAKWPAIVVAKKTQREYQKELLELRFKEEEVGERVTIAGIATWAHIQFHNKLKTLVKDAGVENVPILIQPVREVLPRALRDLTSAAPADWDTFLDEIKNVNVDMLQEKAKRAKERKEAERAQNACIARLENRQDPIEVLRLQMQQTSIRANTAAPRAMTPPRTIGTAPSSATALRRPVRYVAAGQTSTNQRP
ncbi:hypothetical protein EV702DRAFT_1199988 [Suillus placidus]|uniref:Retrotransposon gag domain-containing protein n=1 Tax=Suillus placidus TaxID=48579 RepID=A0A9P6ZQI3_9AGAM|nr:hypothetical protein EV702DRAFT_1199988 [Suillus placidus]